MIPKCLSAALIAAGLALGQAGGEVVANASPGDDFYACTQEMGPKTEIGCCLKTGGVPLFSETNPLQAIACKFPDFSGT